MEVALPLASCVSLTPQCASLVCRMTMGLDGCAEGVLSAGSAGLPSLGSKPSFVGCSPGSTSSLLVGAFSSEGLAGSPGVPGDAVACSGTLPVAGLPGSSVQPIRGLAASGRASTVATRRDRSFRGSGCFMAVPSVTGVCARVVARCGCSAVRRPGSFVRSVT